MRCSALPLAVRIQLHYSLTQVRHKHTEVLNDQVPLVSPFQAAT